MPTLGDFFQWKKLESNQLKSFAVKNLKFKTGSLFQISRLIFSFAEPNLITSSIYLIQIKVNLIGAFGQIRTDSNTSF